MAISWGKYKVTHHPRDNNLFPIRLCRVSFKALLLVIPILTLCFLRLHPLLDNPSQVDSPFSSPYKRTAFKVELASPRVCPVLCISWESFLFSPCGFSYTDPLSLAEPSLSFPSDSSFLCRVSHVFLTLRGIWHLLWKRIGIELAPAFSRASFRSDISKRPVPYPTFLWWKKRALCPGLVLVEKNLCFGRIRIPHSLFSSFRIKIWLRNLLATNLLKENLWFRV